MELGEKIKALRKAHGMTQAQLASDRFTRNMRARRSHCAFCWRAVITARNNAW